MIDMSGHASLLGTDANPLELSNNVELQLTLQWLVNVTSPKPFVHVQIVIYIITETLRHLSAPELAIIFEFKMKTEYLPGKLWCPLLTNLGSHHLSAAVLPPANTHFSETLHSSLRRFMYYITNSSEQKCNRYRPVRLCKSAYSALSRACIISDICSADHHVPLAEALSTSLRGQNLRHTSHSRL